MSDQKKILVVDDDLSLCRLMKSHLGAHGYQVEAANTGEQGLRLLDELQPRLVILDLLLPGMDGFQVCRRIRENPAHSKVQIILLTAVYLSEEDMLQGFHVGADAFLVKPDLILSKPVHLKELQEAVDAVFSKEPIPLKPASTKDRIMIVDDDDKNRRLLRMRFASEGFEVFEAPDGGAALSSVEGCQPHLILMDIKMPVMSGLDVLKELRLRQYDCPVVMMTAYGSESIAVQAFEFGADDYLIKPFDSATAVRRLRHLIENFRLKSSSEQLTERLKKISCDLVNRVNHLETQNQRLEDAYAKVRGLSEFNQRFIKSLSQELRAPLATILSFTSLLCDTEPGSRDPQREKESLAIIYRTSFRLEITLSNLIYLSKIQSDALQIMTGMVPLEPTLEEALALARRSLGREGISIYWYPESGSHSILGERAIFKDIVINMIENCLKRIGEKGEITVELLGGGKASPAGDGPSAPGRCTLRIRDSGANYPEKDLVLSSLIGIDPETMQEGEEPMRLSLCKRLAEAVGWKLEIANRPGGGGEALLSMPKYENEA